MEKVTVSKINNFKDKEVELNGWVYNLRSSGSIAFLQFRDGTGFIQCIISKNDVNDDVWTKVDELTQESSITITGLVTQHPKKQDVFEVQVKNINIIQISEDYPIAKKEHGPDFLLDNRHLWLRSKKQWAIQRIRNTLINAAYEYLNNNDFIKIDSPILTPNACEGTTELFEIDYFDDRKAYLSQSGQLYLEAGIMAHRKVFDFGPVFRAEKSKTRRHLTEFWMLDAEMAFHDFNQNMDIQEELIKHMVSKVLENNRQELEILERNIESLEKILQGDFLRKEYTEIINELIELGSDIKQGEDLGADDETKITQKYDMPIFVTKYPASVKPFYMKRDAVSDDDKKFRSSKADPDNPDFSLCSDLLAPEGYGEIIGGSQREDDFDTLLEYIKEHNLDPEVFNWYLDLRKYGSVPHSGFGFGLERIVTWVCGINHVRETIPFPRLINRIQP